MHSLQIFAILLLPIFYGAFPSSTAAPIGQGLSSDEREAIRNVLWVTQSASAEDQENALKKFAEKSSEAVKQYLANFLKMRQEYVESVKGMSAEVSSNMTQKTKEALAELVTIILDPKLTQMEGRQKAADFDETSGSEVQEEIQKSNFLVRLKQLSVHRPTAPLIQMNASEVAMFNGAWIKLVNVSVDEKDDGMKQLAQDGSEGIKQMVDTYFVDKQQRLAKAKTLAEAEAKKLSPKAQEAIAKFMDIWLDNKLSREEVYEKIDELDDTMDDAVQEEVDKTGLISRLTSMLFYFHG